MKKNDLPALLALLLAVGFLAETSIAQSSRQAQVDLIIFRHNVVTEKQINDIVGASLRHGKPTQESNSPLGATVANAIREGSEVQIITTDGLKEQARKIRESTIFDLLYQVSWRQPAYPLEDALYIPLAPEKHTGLLQVAAKVSFERYFLLMIDLLYDPHLNDLQPVEQGTPENQPLFIRVQETITDDALYYLDHPLLGVVARIVIRKGSR